MTTDQKTAQSRSRIIIADPSAPGVQAHDGLPAIPAGHREATEAEVTTWWFDQAGVLAGETLMDRKAA